MKSLFEGVPKFPEGIDSAIQQAQTFEQLYAALEKFGPLKTDVKEYPIEDLKLLIDEARRFSLEMPMGPDIGFDFNNIPEEFNLRKKVEELISKERK